MAFFNKKNEGGLMDVIRCDQESYLIWKWRPKGQEANTTKKENALRYGSSVRVKEGEIAIFVYPQKDGTQMDIIQGPHDAQIESGNFPVLSSIVGLAFGGQSPFQAEVYFINLAGVIQTQFAVPFFDVYDPRFLDYGVPVAVRGTISFSIADYKEFIKLHRLIDFNLDSFQKQIKDALIKYVKAVVSNIPEENNIPVIQLERKILQINDLVQSYLKPRLTSDFGVTLTELDIAHIECDKTSQGYMELKAVTQDLTTQVAQAQAAVNITQMEDLQRVQMENLSETQRIQREEMQRAQKLQTESGHLTAHQINQQAAVGIAGAQALGQMGAAGGTAVDLGSGGFNPAGLMAGIAVGSALGQNMASMMNGSMAGLGVPPAGMGVPPASMGVPQAGTQPAGMGVPPQAGGFPPPASGMPPAQGGFPPQAGMGVPPAGTPPAGGFPPQAGMGVPPQAGMGVPPASGIPPAPPVPPPATQYHLAVNGQSTGPYDIQTMATLVPTGHLTATTMVWHQGLAGWQPAATLPELAPLFSATTPPPPPPTVPPTVPPAPNKGDIQ